MLDPKCETFLQLVECKSYTSAAKCLNLTQPAVSQQIKKLEEHYGCMLIDSSGHGVRLTVCGRLLYRGLCLQKANEEQLKRQLRGEMELLRVGATLSMADYYLPELLVEQLLAYPERFNVQVGNTSLLVGRLIDGSLDVAFIEGIFDTSLFERHALRYADFVPFAAGSHALAGRPVTEQELKACSLVLREEGSGTREVLAACLAQRGEGIACFGKTVELGSFVLIKELVKHSKAISFAYRGVIKKELEAGELCILDAPEYNFVHPLHFIYRKGSLRAKEYADFYRQMIEH